MLDADCVVGGTRLGQLCVLKLRFFAVSETKASRVVSSCETNIVLACLCLPQPKNGDYKGEA